MLARDGGEAWCPLRTTGREVPAQDDGEGGARSGRRGGVVPARDDGEARCLLGTAWDEVLARSVRRAGVCRWMMSLGMGADGLLGTVLFSQVSRDCSLASR